MCGCHSPRGDFIRSLIEGLSLNGLPLQVDSCFYFLLNLGYGFEEAPRGCRRRFQQRSSWWCKFYGLMKNVWNEEES